MKFLFLLTVFSLLFHLPTRYLVAPYLILHTRADRCVEVGEFQHARVMVENVLTLQPCFFEREANIKAGEIYFAAIHYYISIRDFRSAVDWIICLQDRLKKHLPTGYEEESERIAQNLPLQHLRYARDTVYHQRKDFSSALEEFELMEKLYPSFDEIQTEREFQEQMCRIEFAKSLLDIGNIEKSIGLLADVQSSKNIPHRLWENVIEYIPVVTEEICNRKVRAGEFDDALRLVRWVRMNFNSDSKSAKRLDKFAEQMIRATANHSEQKYEFPSSSVHSIQNEDSK